MPFVNIKLVDGVFTPEEKHAMAKAITDVRRGRRARC